MQFRLTALARVNLASFFWRLVVAELSLSRPILNLGSYMKQVQVIMKQVQHNNAPNVGRTKAMKMGCDEVVDAITNLAILFTEKEWLAGQA